MGPGVLPILGTLTTLISRTMDIKPAVGQQLKPPPDVGQRVADRVMSIAIRPAPA
jgi:hypothetical protein